MALYTDNARTTDKAAASLAKRPPPAALSGQWARRNRRTGSGGRAGRTAGGSGAASDPWSGPPSLWHAVGDRLAGRLAGRARIGAPTLPLEAEAGCGVWPHTLSQINDA